MMEKELVRTAVCHVLDELRQHPIPLGVSNRHVHLSQTDYQQLFPDQPLAVKKSPETTRTICRRTDSHRCRPERSSEKRPYSRTVTQSEPD